MIQLLNWRVFNMALMKTILTILFTAFTLLFVKAYAQQSDTSKIKITVEKMGWHISHHYPDSLMCLEVKVSLTNMTPDTQKFINYTCSYNLAFTTSSGFWVGGFMCNANVPRVYKLTPKGTDGSSRTYSLEVFPSPKLMFHFKKHASNLKIGFKWYKYYNFFSCREIILYKPDEIIWSDSIMIN